MDGVVIIDKPKGITSHTVVQRVKKACDAVKAGHSGTLDPMATGVLPVCLDGATRLASDLILGDKEYDVVIRLGIDTTTYDMEGDVVAMRDLPADIEERVRAVIPEFIGEIDQVPPYFSAVKYRGKPLYKWARKGKLIDLPPRKVLINSINVSKIESGRIYAHVRCSKGTYIRSLCSDIGKRLGVGACMEELRRVRCGQFHISDAICLHVLESASCPASYVYAMDIKYKPLKNPVFTV